MQTDDTSGTDDAVLPRLTAADQISAACERFGAARRAGQQPRIEAFLAEVPAEVVPPLLRRMLLLELEWARAEGRRPKPADYQARFPEFAAVVNAAFAEASATQTAPAHDLLARTACADDLLARPTIPGYEIVDELGRGGMGVVYRARQLPLNRICAVKMISSVGPVGCEVALRFLAEAKTIAMVRHPNVVQVYHSGQHDGRLFFEMEYVEGGNLAGRLTGTPWPASRAARLIDSVARAVDEVHQHRIVHRDLKPANILLTSDGTPKVADFGLAKSLDPGAELTVAGVILGTPNYMAPEQAEGMSRAVGVATDVYALGAILYELLTGHPPFRGATKLEVIEKIKGADPQPPSRLVPGVPSDLEAVCLKCLRKSPAERYDTAGELAEDLRRYINGESTLARPAGGHWKSPLRGLLYPTLGTAGLLVGLVGLTLFLSHRNEPKEAVPKAAKTGPAPLGVPYVVQPGEYPFSIATRLLGDGTRWKEMRRANGRGLGEEDARTLLPGETIYLPPFTPP